MSNQKVVVITDIINGFWFIHSRVACLNLTASLEAIIRIIVIHDR